MHMPWNDGLTCTALFAVANQASVSEVSVVVTTYAEQCCYYKIRVQIRPPPLTYSDCCIAG